MSHTGILWAQTDTTDRIKSGWNVGGLPVVSFDSDLGFQYGALVNLYHYGDGSRYPQLVGGDGTLATDDPRKTVGSYWPYATTVFDYVRRAMPFGEAQSLTNDEVYSVVAFLLTLNGVIDEGTVMNAETLPKVVMPNADGFYDDDRPDVSNTACMKNCKDEVTIVSNAKKVGVTPELEQKSLTGD